MVKEYKKYGEELSPEEFNELINEYFETQLSDGTQVQLVPNGEELRVCHSNYKRFIHLLVRTRI